MQKVTEQDFRMPEFRDANPEDYEFREDGVIVRKDRWEQGIRTIVSHFSNANIDGINYRQFEIEQVTEAVRKLCENSTDADMNYDDDLPF